VPFTVSHAVVAFAARRTPLPVAAVAVGAMAPDAVLFVPALPPYTVAHSPFGIVTIDLVVALVTLALWWVLVRPAWTPVLPTPLRDRLPADWVRPPRLRWVDVPLVVVACVLGSVTHVVWDAFTHPHGRAVAVLPVLRSAVAGHPVYAVVQDCSSVAGLVALGVAAVVWWRQTAPRADAGDVTDARRASRPAVLEARVAPAVAVTVVLLVAVVTAVRALLAGGGVGGGVLAEAFRLPAAVAVVLVVGAVVLRLRSGGGERSGQPDGEERGEVRA
jgi:hypothetical protein